VYFLNLYGNGLKEQYFDHRDQLSKETLRSNIDPNMPNPLSFQDLTLVRYNNHIIIAFFAPTFMFTTSILYRHASIRIRVGGGDEHRTHAHHARTARAIDAHLVQQIANLQIHTNHLRVQNYVSLVLLLNDPTRVGSLISSRSTSTRYVLNYVLN
jgi:hypothetical protein